MYFNYYYDPTMIFLLPAIILALYAEFKVNYNIKKYSKVMSRQGFSGADVARQLLMLAGINDVEVKVTRGKLTDNYNPADKTLNLSHDVYESNSLAAIGIAAHETGHAIQHQDEYFPLVLRSSIVPLVNFSSHLSVPLIFIGLIFSRGSSFILNLGIILFAIVVIFQLVTLPVEFNASRRAVKLLAQNNFLDESEMPAIKKVLGAAALTYVAAAVSALANLIRYIIIARNRRD